MLRNDLAAGAGSPGSGPLPGAPGRGHPPLDRWLHLAPGSWRLGLLLAAILFVLLGVVGRIALAGPREAVAGSWMELVSQGPGSEAIAHWQRWDALWYQRIAESGYRAGDGTAAFYPLYPLLGRIVSTALGVSAATGLLAVSAMACIGGATALWHLVKSDFGSRSVATLTVLLTALSPVGFFLLAPFTESLFLLTSVLAILFARQGRPWVAGTCGFLAALTRTQGVLLVVPIAWEVVRQARSADWVRGRGGRPPGLGLVAAILPLVGFLTVAAFQRIVVGESRTALQLQEIWGFAARPPWEVLAASLTYIQDRANSDGARAVELLNFVAFVTSAVVIAVEARRVPSSYVIYGVLSLGILSVRTNSFSPMMSDARFMLVVFPVAAIIAARLAGRPRIAAAAISISLCLQIILFQYFVRWGFVG